MDRGAWRASVHGVTKIVTDHAYTKLPDLMFQRNHPKHIHVGSFLYSEGMTIN